MKKVTESISKAVMTINDAEIAGNVLNAVTDEKLGKIKGWCVVNDDEDTTSMLPLKNVYSAGDVFTVKSRDSILPCGGVPCPLGASAYTTAGQHLGKLKDVIYDENSGNTLTLLIGCGKYNAARVISFSDLYIMLKSTDDEKILCLPAPKQKDAPDLQKKSNVAKKSAKTSAKKRKTAQEIFPDEHSETALAQVEAFSAVPSTPGDAFSQTESRTQPEQPPIINDKTVTTSASPNEEVVQAQFVATPPYNQAPPEAQFSTDSVLAGNAAYPFGKILYDFAEYAFLLGRLVTKNIPTNSGNIAKMGQIVDENVLYSAKIDGRLVELTVNSKKL